jgi:hypothetical protein
MPRPVECKRRAIGGQGVGDVLPTVPAFAFRELKNRQIPSSDAQWSVLVLESFPIPFLPTFTAENGASRPPSCVFRFYDDSRL